MKPSLQFSVPCLRVVEDGGPPSFVRIFYELPFPKFPYTFPDPGFFIANGWCNGTGTHKQAIQILRPDKKTILIETGEQEFHLMEQKTPFMLVNLFQNVVFDEPGLYWIRVFLNGEVAIEYPMEVRVAEGKKEVTKEEPVAEAKKPEASEKQASQPGPLLTEKDEGYIVT